MYAAVPTTIPILRLPVAKAARQRRRVHGIDVAA